MNNPLDTALHGDAQPRLAGHKQPQACHRVITSIPSIAQYHISLLYGMLNIDDQHRNPTMNNKDNLAGHRVVTSIPSFHHQFQF